MTGRKPRPFNEFVADISRRPMTLSDMEVFALLLESTAISKNHDEIAAAWRKACLHVGVSEERTEHIAHLVLSQKPKHSQH